MKKFVSKIAVFFCVFGTLVYGISILSNTNKNDYMEAIVAKHQRIDSIDAPKIILAGGSKIAFGVNSKKMENELGMPVVNLGLHAGLGLSFMLKELEHTIQKGDVVILSIEYFLAPMEDYELMQYTADLYPEAKNYYQKSRFLELKVFLAKTAKKFKALFQREHKKEDNNTDEVYAKNGFNNYGDIVAHLELPQPSNFDKIPKEKLTYRHWEGIELINEFHKTADEKGVKVFYALPTYCESQYVKNEKPIMHLYDDLQQELEVELLNQPSDFVYQDSLFYDTEYHLHKQGTEKRTEKFIELLEKEI